MILVWASSVGRSVGRGYVGVHRPLTRRLVVLSRTCTGEAWSPRVPPLREIRNPGATSVAVPWEPRMVRASIYSRTGLPDTAVVSGRAPGETRPCTMFPFS